MARERLRGFQLFTSKFFIGSVLTLARRLFHRVESDAELRSARKNQWKLRNVSRNWATICRIPPYPQPITSARLGSGIFYSSAEISGGSMARLSIAAKWEEQSRLSKPMMRRVTAR